MLRVIKIDQIRHEIVIGDGKISETFTIQSEDAWRNLLTIPLGTKCNEDILITLRKNPSSKGVSFEKK